MTTTLIGIQDKLVAAEIKAIEKHGDGSCTSRKVIFAARTRAKNALLEMGFTLAEARQAVLDARDMVILQLAAQEAAVAAPAVQADDIRHDPPVRNGVLDSAAIAQEVR